MRYLLNGNALAVDEDARVRICFDWFGALQE
jgi:hypothetical protein